MSTYHELFEHAMNMDHGRSNYQAYYAKDAFFSNNALHSHNFYEIFIHISGGDIYRADDKSVVLEHGSMMILHPFEMHGHCGQLVLKDYERFFLYISPEMLRKISCDLFPIQKYLDESTKNGNSIFQLNNDQFERAKRCIQQIMKNCEQDTPLTKLADISLLIEFMLTVMECMENKQIPEVISQADANLMQPVVTYINDHFDQPLTLTSLAETFHMSKSSLSHHFRAYAGHSVYDYVLYCRYIYAKQLIFAGTSFTETAYKCGFGDYSSFLKAFKQFGGCSPREYLMKMNKSS